MLLGKYKTQSGLFLDYRVHPGLDIFDCATSSFSGARILHCVSMIYVELSTSCCLSWKATLVPSLHLLYWSINLPLRHSLACCRCCLIASSWNLPANVSDHLTSSEMSTVFMMRNTLLALDDFYYHRQHPWLPFIANLSTLWIQLALQLVLCSALKYYCLLCRKCCGDCST